MNSGMILSSLSIWNILSIVSIHLFLRPSKVSKSFLRANASSEFFSSNETQNSTSYSATSNQQQSSQNNSSNLNVERNTSENLNERTRNLRDETPNVLTYFLDTISNNQYDIASSLTDASGNLLNNIFNDTLSDPSTILTLLTALNNRNQR